ncbi:hypothetical protein [Mucilaginibacter terrenus]|uniref:hypothetical protein n=1 Tax=Mucilaginibacter terrenus TaxID=2482727 RepID=UPI001403BB0B|nr:hypothetical protein [Mucilaginibacter terrenus]
MDQFFTDDLEVTDLLFRCFPTGKSCNSQHREYKDAVDSSFDVFQNKAAGYHQKSNAWYNDREVIKEQVLMGSVHGWHYLKTFKSLLFKPARI